MKKVWICFFLISVTSLTGFVKKDQDKCLHCKECYDTAWDDGYWTGYGTGAVNERYRITRSLIQIGKTDEELVRMIPTSYVELKDVREQLKLYHGYFEFEMSRYEQARTLLKKGKTNEEIVKKTNLSFYELELVKQQLKQNNGMFLWELHGGQS
ncbi:hypothetical protein [Neobacillus soli]|uniref:hypothetical protein n=1 Tax=Neobacillus soli TaxID=220688 RepID=UPI000824B976|nr:hypothetical protein [Neobacillus soli]